MSLSRRSFVKAGAAAGIAASAPALAATGAKALVIYDGTVPQSVAFARGWAGGQIAVAELHRDRWQTLRAPLPPGRIVGLTRWSDYLMARGYAEEQGRRLVSERHAGGLIGWEMG